MDARQLTPTLAVTPQIAPADVPAIAAAGFRVLINNRPDDEVGPDQGSAAIGAAARAAGLAYHHLPLPPGGLTPALIAGMAQALDGTGPALAYCRSGNRSTVLWALSQAGRIPPEDMLAAARGAGQDLTPVLPMIEQLARGR